MSYGAEHAIRITAKPALTRPLHRLRPRYKPMERRTWFPSSETRLSRCTVAPNHRMESFKMPKSRRARSRTARVKVTKPSVRKFVLHQKRGDSKQDHVLDLLRGPSGVTIENV